MKFEFLLFDDIRHKNGMPAALVAMKSDFGIEESCWLTPHNIHAHIRYFGLDLELVKALEAYGADVTELKAQAQELASMEQSKVVQHAS